MNKNNSKWALPFWTGGTIIFGSAVVYGLVGGGFEKYQLAALVFFAFMAIDTWRKHRKHNQNNTGTATDSET